MSDRTVCVHHNRPSECQQCEDEIPDFLRRQTPDPRDSQIAALTAKLAKVKEIADEAEALHFHDTANVDRAANGYRAIRAILREVGQ